MPRLKIIIVLVAAAALAACMTDKTPPSPRHTASLVSVGDLAQAARGATSFAFMPDGQIVPPDARINTPQIEAEIQHTIRGIITARGYEFTTPDRADRLIGYAVALESTLSDQDIQTLVGFTPGAASADGLERGTVLLGISYPGNRRLVWSAGMQGVADLTASDIKRRQRINKALEQLLIGLPKQSAR